MYSRRRCGLCDDARAVLMEALAEGGFEYREVFIDGEDALERDYGLRVPVVLVDGVEEFEARVDPADLRRALRA